MEAVLFLVGIFLLFLFVACLIFAKESLSKHSSTPNHPKQKEILVKSLDEEPEDFWKGTFATYIAGVGYHASEKDAGAFVGVVAPDPTNIYDKNAIAIYRNDTKLLGYIGKREQREYKEWSNRKTCPCVGYIKTGDYTNDNGLIGRIKVIKPYNIEYVKNETKGYLKWALEQYGKQFVSEELIKTYEL